jgi:hypothetical protein
MNSDQKEKIERERRNAKERLSKNDFMQFRCDGDLIMRLNSVAKERNLPVTRMVREWVTERLIKEESACSEEQPTTFESALFSVWKRALTRSVQPNEPWTKKQLQTVMVLLDLVLPGTLVTDAKEPPSFVEVKPLVQRLTYELSSINERLLRVEENVKNRST